MPCEHCPKASWKPLKVLSRRIFIFERSLWLKPEDRVEGNMSRLRKTCCCRQVMIMTSNQSGGGLERMAVGIGKLDILKLHFGGQNDRTRRLIGYGW